MLSHTQGVKRNCKRLNRLWLSALVCLVWTQIGLAQEDPDLQELKRQQQQMVDQMNSLNMLNPVSNAVKNQSAPASGAMGEAGQIDTSKLPPNLQWAAKIMQDQRVTATTRKAMGIAQDPEFQRNALLVRNNPKLKWMYVGFLVVTLLYYLIKRRVLAATDRFFTRLVLRLALLPVFFGGMFLVAYGTLGQPLVDLLAAAARVALKG